MHQLFADWLVDAGLEVGNQPLSAWSEGLAEYASTLDRESLLALLRFAAPAEAVEQREPPGLREAIKEKDPSFLMRGNGFLVGELARVTTRLLFDGDDVDEKLGRAAALGMIVGAFGQPVGAVHQEHLRKAQEYIAMEAQRLRSRPTVVAAAEAGREAVLTAIKGASDHGSLRDQVAQLAGLAFDAIDKLSFRLRVEEEENDILWWLFGEVSRDLKRPFRDLERGAAELVAASELAELTAFTPGPSSAEAMLRRAVQVGGGRATMLSKAVGGLDRDWKRRAVKPLVALGEAVSLCPVHLVAAKSAEAAKPEDLPSLVRAVLGIELDEDIAEVALALQFYQERMFVRAIELVPESQ